MAVRIRVLISVVITALVSTMVVLTGPSSTPRAEAAVSARSLSVTLLGDSYSAGNGAGAYYGPEGSYRSYNNWAQGYVDWLNGQGVHTTLDNLAHSGYVTSQMISDQLPQVSSSTDLVMLTAGGNDVHFADIVAQCFVSGPRDAKGCKEKVEAADGDLPGAITNTNTILNGLQGKLASDAQVVLVGYPLLSLDTDYTLNNCVDRNFLGICKESLSYTADDEVRRLGRKAEQLQSELVRTWNLTHSLKVTYVPMTGLFAGHEPDPAVLSENPYRWINELLETEGEYKSDGTVGAPKSKTKDYFYHPNKIGHREIAAGVTSAVGIPATTNTVDQYNSAFDIAFVVDTTGSMSADINAVRSNIASIIGDVRDRSSSARFALVDFKDHPVDGGDSSDYPARLDSGFTTSVETIRARLDELSADGGGDYPESVYSGVMTALDLPWRTGVKKIVIVLGDAPPKDPEPVTGYTASSVAARAFAIDPAVVYGVDTSGLADTSFQSLVDATGGKVYSTSSTADIPTAFTDAVVAEAKKPFGWLQGPILARQGDRVTLDARGSYAVNGAVGSYEWDFDGDGTYEASTTTPTTTHVYPGLLAGTVGVRVTDSDGRASVGSTSLSVTRDGDTVADSIDNCPDIANGDQGDLDADGVGDACDPTPGQPAADQPGVFEVVNGIPSIPAVTATITGLTQTSNVPGQPVTVTVTVADAKAGIVTVDGASGVPVSAPVDAAGRSLITLPALAPGSHAVTVGYANGNARAAARSFTLVVGKSSGVLRASVARKPTAAKRARLRVAFSALGVVASGPLTVTVKKAGRHGVKVAKATATNGLASVRLPRLGKGRYSVTVSFAGSASIGPVSTTIRIRVR